MKSSDEYLRNLKSSKLFLDERLTKSFDVSDVFVSDYGTYKTALYNINSQEA
jgi:hypothetical protein